MKITIEITKKDAIHISGTHTFYDCCAHVESIMLQVQREVNKKVKKL